MIRALSGAFEFNALFGHVERDEHSLSVGGLTLNNWLLGDLERTIPVFRRDNYERLGSFLVRKGGVADSLQYPITQQFFFSCGAIKVRYCFVSLIMYEE
ncbi:MAG TPA: hypothetical protein VF075_09260 [Pyrinomonadaceae bacterium]